MGLPGVKMFFETETPHAQTVCYQVLLVNRKDIQMGKGDRCAVFGNNNDRR